MKGIKTLFAIGVLLLSLPAALHAEGAGLLAANKASASNGGDNSRIITVIGCWYGPGSAADADAMFTTNDGKEVDVARVSEDIYSPIIEACSSSTHLHASKNDACCRLTFEGYMGKNKTYKIKRVIKAQELK